MSRIFRNFNAENIIPPAGLLLCFTEESFSIYLNQLWQKQGKIRSAS